VLSGSFPQNFRAIHCRVAATHAAVSPLGNRQVHIGVEEGVERLATKAHSAYEVSDLGGWKAKLAALGIEVVEGFPIPGYDRFEFRDPFGNRVEFLERQ
jgi:catechol 2,3-dioxygenase-like lactoylglutathione lyase family enzyme